MVSETPSKRLDQRQDPVSPDRTEKLHSTTRSVPSDSAFAVSLFLAAPHGRHARLHLHNVFVGMQECMAVLDFRIAVDICSPLTRGHSLGTSSGITN
jgi:hypothetical protein